MGCQPRCRTAAPPATPTTPTTSVDVYLADWAPRATTATAPPRTPTAPPRWPATACSTTTTPGRSTAAPPLNSLQVTAAHEFFHAIQFGYDVTEDLWFMEGRPPGSRTRSTTRSTTTTSTSPTSPIRYPRTSLDYERRTPSPTASFIFFTYAAERRPSYVVRQFWEPRRSAAAPRSRRSTASSAPTAWPAFFTTFGSWNTLPLHSYSERAGYPSPACWRLPDPDRPAPDAPAGAASASRTSASAHPGRPGSNLRTEQASAGRRSTRPPAAGLRGPAAAPLPRRPRDPHR